MRPGTQAMYDGLSVSRPVETTTGSELSALERHRQVMMLTETLIEHDPTGYLWSGPAELLAETLVRLGWRKPSNRD